jgi:segregation and condensation protein B
MSAANENEVGGPKSSTTTETTDDEAAESTATAESPSSETADDQQNDKTENSEETDWNDVTVRAALEAIFFAADEPLTMKNLLQALEIEDESLVRRAVGQMKLDYNGDARGIHLIEVAGGFQMRTNPTYNEAVLQLLEAKPTRLSRAAMETLAIVAYRQPVTKAIVDDIRGVDCGGVLRSLTDVELLAVIGKADDIGRPNLYGTTTRFLEFFGLDSLTGLPTLEDFEVDALELLGEDFDDLLAHPDDDEGDDDEVEKRDDEDPQNGEAGEKRPQQSARPKDLHSDREIELNAETGDDHG